MTALLGPIVTIACVVGVFWCLIRPRWAAVVVLFMYPVEQLLQMYVPFLARVPWASNVGIGLLGGFAVFSAMGQGQRPTLGYKNPVTVMAWLLLILVMVSSIWSPNGIFQIFRFQKVIPFYILLIIIAPLLVRDLRDFHGLVIGLLVVGTFLSAVILFNPSVVFVSARLRLASEGATNPLVLGALGGTTALIAVLAQFDRVGRLMTVLRAGAVLVGLGVAISSGSRGQALIMILVGVMFYPMARRVPDVKAFFVNVLGFAILAGIGYLAFKMALSGDAAGRWTGERIGDSVEGRWLYITTLLGGWMESPAHWLFGLGTGAFGALWTLAGFVHNMPVEVLCEQGLVGMGLLMGIVILGYSYLFKLWRWVKDDPALRATTATLGALATYEMILSFKQGSLANRPESLLYLVIIAKIYWHEIIAAGEAEAEYDDEPMDEWDIAVNDDGMLPA